MSVVLHCICVPCLSDTPSPLPPHTQRSSLPKEVVVKGLPSHVSRFHIRERLSMLAGNCGGKVMEVHTTSAVVRFATPELAAR